MRVDHLAGYRVHHAIHACMEVAKQFGQEEAVALGKSVESARWVGAQMREELSLMPATDDSPIKLHDVVVYVDDRQQLRSGASQYPFAVVASLDPFILLSEMADMKWQATIRIEEFRSIGRASDSMMRRAHDRLHGVQLKVSPKSMTLNP